MKRNVHPPPGVATHRLRTAILEAMQGMRKRKMHSEALAISHRGCLIRGLVSISGQSLCFFHPDLDVGVNVGCAGGVQGHVSNIFKVSIKLALCRDVI